MQPSPVPSAPITIADVQPYASKHCKSCRGSGVVTQCQPGGPVRRQASCGCALRRFFARRRDDFIHDLGTGSMSWRPDVLEPKETQ